MLFVPHKYQDNIIEWEIEKAACGAFVDMGLGKTICTLMALDFLMAVGEVKNPLIIAPLNVVKNVWTAEALKWDHTNHIEFAQVHGSIKGRSKAILLDRQVTIINYENIPWLVKHFKRKWPYDMVICDESSKLKNHGSVRFKRLRQIQKLVKRWVLLTGTPATNGLINIWSQIYLLDSGRRLEDGIGKFRTRYFEPSVRPHGAVWSPRPGASKIIYSKIKDICVSMKTEDYLELPEFKVVPIFVDLPGKARKIYDEMERELYTIIQEEGISAPNTGAKITKLRQIANGAVYPEPGDKRYIELHNEKLDVLERIVDEFYGEPILISYAYKSDTKRIGEMFKGFELAGGGNENVQERWNAGQIPQLGLYAGSDAHGLNLQEGGRVGVWFGATYDLDAWLQFNKRLIRQGQARSGFIYVIVARDTIEEEMMERVETKKTWQDCLLEALKRRQRKK